jgi:hypothetical protein
MFELSGFFILFTFLVNLVLSELCFSSFIVLSLIGLTHGWPETGFLREYFVTAHQLRKTRFLWFQCVTLEYLDCLGLRAIVNLVS